MCIHCVYCMPYEICSMLSLISFADDYITSSLLQFKNIYEVEIKEIQDDFQGYNQPTEEPEFVCERPPCKDSSASIGLSLCLIFIAVLNIIV